MCTQSSNKNYLMPDRKTGSFIVHAGSASVPDNVPTPIVMFQPSTKVVTRGDSSAVVAGAAESTRHGIAAHDVDVRWNAGYAAAPAYGESCMIGNNDGMRPGIFVCAITLRSVAMPPADKSASLKTAVEEEAARLSGERPPPSNRSQLAPIVTQSDVLG